MFIGEFELTSLIHRMNNCLPWFDGHTEALICPFNQCTQAYVKPFNSPQEMCGPFNLSV